MPVYAALSGALAGLLLGLFAADIIAERFALPELPDTFSYSAEMPVWLPERDGRFTGSPAELALTWPARYFSPGEFASKGDGTLNVSQELVAGLDRMRGQLGFPLRITSAYRDPDHNHSIGGASRSRHVQGDAVDISLSGLSVPQRQALIQAALRWGFSSFGTYTNSDILHIDRRPQARGWHRPARGRDKSVLSGHAWSVAVLRDAGWQRNQAPKQIDWSLFPGTALAAGRLFPGRTISKFTAI